MAIGVWFPNSIATNETVTCIVGRYLLYSQVPVNLQVPAIKYPRVIGTSTDRWLWVQVWPVTCGIPAGNGYRSPAGAPVPTSAGSDRVHKVHGPNCGNTVDCAR